MTPPDESESLPSQKPIGDDSDALKRQTFNTKPQVSELEYQPPEKKKSILEVWGARLVLLVVLLLASIPPAMVVAHQWLSILPGDWQRATWCKVDFLCRTYIPSYFIVILGCFFVLLILMFFWGRKPIVIIEHALEPINKLDVGTLQKRIGTYLAIACAEGMIAVIILSQLRQKWPGWDLVLMWFGCLAGLALQAVSADFLVNRWKKDGEYWIALLLAHISIITVLAAYYDVTQIFYLSLLLLALAFGNLWRFRKRVPAIFWIISITLAFYSININGWWTSVIGDDYNFHDLAWQFAEKMSFTQIGEVLFRADGAHGTHPYFSSFVQGISMKLLGHDGFGWRFSNLYLVAMGAGLFYFFCKSFLGKREAQVAASLLAFSHYVMSFGKIGYNNLQALFALTLALAITVWAIRWKQTLAFAVLGSVMALCFYLYPASLYVIPVPFILLLLYYPPTSRTAAGNWFVMIGLWIVMIYPLMMQPVYWDTKVGGTIFNRPDLVQSIPVIVEHFAKNIFYSIFSILYIAEGHYIAVSYIDPVSAIFVIIGYFILLYQIRRQRFAIFTALTFVLFLFTVGASHDREAPPDTRMFLLLPLFALFGMWGIMWVEQSIKKADFFKWNPKIMMVPALLVVIAGTNLYQAYQLSYKRYEGVQSAETLFVGITQSIQKAEPNSPKNFAVILGERWSIAGLVEFQNVYPHLAWFQIYRIHITEPILPEADMALFSERNTLIMVSPYLPPEWQNALDAPLRALGKARCDVLTPDGQKRFVLYYSPDLPAACPTW